MKKVMIRIVMILLISATAINGCQSKEEKTEETEKPVKRRKVAKPIKISEDQRKAIKAIKRMNDTLYVKAMGERKYWLDKYQPKIDSAGDSTEIKKLQAELKVHLDSLLEKYDLSPEDLIYYRTHLKLHPKRYNQIKIKIQMRADSLKREEEK